MGGAVDGAVGGMPNYLQNMETWFRKLSNVGVVGRTIEELNPTPWAEQRREVRVVGRGARGMFQ